MSSEEGNHGKGNKEKSGTGGKYNCFELKKGNDVDFTYYS